MSYYRWDSSATPPVDPVYFRVVDDGAAVEVLRDGAWVASEQPSVWIEGLQDPFVSPVTEGEIPGVQL